MTGKQNAPSLGLGASAAISRRTSTNTVAESADTRVHSAHSVPSAVPTWLTSHRVDSTSGCASQRAAAALTSLAAPLTIEEQAKWERI
ncbi:hypothetical protein FHX48_000699 [Microbacterium halimionae]|uniref:Uncharacterized protein n=1 Tax=Microbacterium halimionae TaxID=1526413 RepID=A0A7W3JMN4_9MICO|nr:hypothetical protein [Microbacterium halimionae]